MQSNLLSVLTKEDRSKIENFITSYGIEKSNFVGLDEWLEPWSCVKRKLYRLLGNKLIYSKQINLKKDASLIQYEMESLYEHHKFHFTLDSLNSFIAAQEKTYTEIEYELQKIREFLYALTLPRGELFLYNNKAKCRVKMKCPNKKGTLQINEDMSIIKAIKRILDYFKDEFSYDEALFDDFRTKLSMIQMEEFIKGELCFSIHPLDFLTMSSNSVNWTSCMSWTEEGCYKVGTVEMMNSNNAICCYLKSSTSYNFSKYDEADPLYEWNNKKWRSLIFVTKDIIMVGKSYPFFNELLSKEALNIMRELAKNSLNWDYEFGPELYKDMKHIFGCEDVDHVRIKIKSKLPHKKRLVWDTNGMYNDMINNHDYAFWCVRNRIKHNKVINISGKCMCLKCGELNYLEPNYEADNYDDDQDMYNSRWNNVDALLCENCINDYYCAACGEFRPEEKMYKFTIEKFNGEEEDIKICKSCYDKYVRKCPCCGRPFYLSADIGGENGYWIESSGNRKQILYYTKNNETDIKDNFDQFVYTKFHTHSRIPLAQFRKRIEEQQQENKKLYREYLFMCHDCYIKSFKGTSNIKTIKIPLNHYSWHVEATFMPDSEKAQKFRYLNLEPVDNIPQKLYVNYCDT